jgi:hypothetical protein
MIVCPSLRIFKQQRHIPIGQERHESRGLKPNVTRPIAGLEIGAPRDSAETSGDKSSLSALRNP